MGILRKQEGKLVGKGAPNWRGGIRTSGKYVYVFMPEHPFHDYKGCVLQHRLVMEESLGRYLTKDEIVHHINYSKKDNRLENLQLMTRAEHTILHKTHLLISK